MSTLSRDFLSRTKGRIRSFTHDTDREAGMTLETLVLWVVIGAAAIAIAAALVALLWGWFGQIPTSA